MLPAKQFYMIRHGQTEANAKQIMAGWTDSPLTDLGRKQARAVHNIVEHLTIKPKAIIHSHLSRARETAEIINEVLKLELYEDPDLAEMNAGDMEGQPYEIARPLFEGWPVIPNAEHPQDFFDRIKRGKIKALEKDGPVLIVCHGGVMRAFGEIYGVPVPGRFRNAHLYDFNPNTSNTNFPWDVYSYDICAVSGSLKKDKSDIYSGQ
ncbi:MAG: histidine phosphatase family protein [Alphaproteobacteria bacterium]